ncbi:MAG: PEGA domain-containing protein [Candidatus Uhrbacteria bacterium]
MPLRLRRIMYLSFIALFLVVAPILALYSMGFRYHPGKHRIERTGLLVVNGQPDDASVVVNGAIRARGLPARIGGLGENEYVVRVERAGYRPWERRIFVRSGWTVFADEISLFREAEPQLVMPGEIGTFVVSPRTPWAAFTRTTDGSTELWLLNQRTGSRTLALRLPLGKHEISNEQNWILKWAPHDDLLLVETPGDVIIVNAEPVTTRSLATLLPQPPTTVDWELGNTPSASIIAVSEGRLFRYNNTTERMASLTVPPPMVPFTVVRGNLFSVVDNTIAATSLDDRKVRAIATLPTNTRPTTFTDAYGGTLTAETNAPVRTLIIDIGNGTVQEIAGRRADNSGRSDPTLWIVNNIELWFRTNDKPPQFLTRQMEPIISAQWDTTTRTAIIATEREVSAITPNGAAAADPPTTIARFDTIQGMAPFADSRTIVIAGRRGNIAGLWELPLR